MSPGERLEMLQDCLDRGDITKLDRFSPQELYDAMLCRGQADEEVVRYVRTAQELGLTFLHQGVCDSPEEDEAFMAEVLPFVFPELAEDGTQS